MAALENITSGAQSIPSVDLIREANHRIANHLSLIVGMVQMQVSAVARGPETLRRDAVHTMLQETAGKIISVSHLHRKLADQPQDSDIDLGGFIVESCTALVSSLSLNGRIGIVYELGEKCMLPAEKAQLVSLMVSEMVMNAVKYAHPTDIPVQVHLTCACDHVGSTFVEVQDDGVGLPENFDEKTSGGVGFKLMRSLAKQLGGSLKVDSSSLGLCLRLTLPA